MTIVRSCAFLWRGPSGLEFGCGTAARCLLAPIICFPARGNRGTPASVKTPMHRSGHRGFAVLVLALLAGCATAPPVPKPAGPPVAQGFEVGPGLFGEGDSIRIDSVECSSPDFARGDRVIVRGWYDLKSRPQAKLQLVQTHEGPAAPDDVAPNQWMPVAQGVGQFELECVVPGTGALHVSFYVKGRPVGGVYFGTKSQMAWAAGINGL